MSVFDEIIKERKQKAEAIKRAGFSVYPLTVKKTHTVAKALQDFSKIQKSGKEVFLVGRVRTIRGHGKITFLHFNDGSGLMQALLKQDILGEKSYRFFLENFDIGDIAEFRGVLLKTKKGEKTIEVRNFRMLTKNFLPLPEKWHGLKDIEDRYRKRYLDLIFNPEVKNKFEIRAKIIQEIRSFLEREEFLEVETPILQPIYGGAKAKPFKTHLNALDMDLYLRIAPELYLKRLLIGGIEKVYEIGRVFRNEGIDRSHNPDFTTLEFYWAYADYKDLMALTEKMLVETVKKILGKTTIEYNGKKINFKAPFERIEFSQLIKRHTKIDIDGIHLEKLKEEAKKMGIVVSPDAKKAEIADEIYKEFCLSKIQNPLFVIHHPIGAFALAKQLESNPKKLANFQLVIAGWELINAFSELNDPIEQRKRFEEQEKSFKLGFEEAQRIDEDFLEALGYGMPPAAGFGMGIDRLAALLTDSHNLREVILFPTMKSQQSKA